MTTASPTVLSQRPRRPVVRREPSQRAAARTLRRSAEPTTGRTWLRSGLPSRPLAEAGVPWSESLLTLALVALVFVPLLLWSQGTVATWVVLGVALAVASALLTVRRVLVGRDYVAVRRLGRYHVATVDHVRHLELRPTEHGGVLCLHTDDGRCMRLRRVELADPGVGAALQELARRHGGTFDAHAEGLLALPHDEARLRSRYLAA